MSAPDRCANCNGWPPEHQRMTLARPKSGDLIFCGYGCLRRWEARQAQPAPSPSETEEVRHPPASAVAEAQAVAHSTHGQPQDRCRSCQEPIRWGETAGGKRAPFNVSDSQNHFVTCPQRREWRKAEQPKQSSLFDFGEAPPAAPPSAARHWEG